MTISPLPTFRPHPLLRGGHVQTLAGYWLRGTSGPADTVKHHVELADGDQIVLHDDQPANWTAGDRAALLLPGLAGCYQSGFLVRIAFRLNERGVRTFRMDHRGTGAGVGLASNPYHAGRSDDVRTALQAIGELCPASPLAVAGFSLSGNMVLKMLGELPDDVPAQLDRAAVFNPPIDLARCTTRVEQVPSSLYGRHFTKLLCDQLSRQPRLLADSPLARPSSSPRSLREFDEIFTAPKSGFASADDYYRRSSAAQFVPAIRVSTLIVTSRDDPLVPYQPFEALDCPSAVSLHIAESGGHLGYIGRSGIDADRRWMDWRVVDWITHSEG